MKHILSSLFIVVCSWAFAVDESLNGTVYDADTKEPLPFTNIVIEGTHNGTVANVDGQFVLDLSTVQGSDFIVFSYVGYESQKISVTDLMQTDAIYMKPATLGLNAVAVYSKELNADDILEKVVENYEANHPQPNQKQRVFYHKYEKALWPKSNKVRLKESDFDGLDKEELNGLFKNMPEAFVEYHDALIDFYTYDGDNKVHPVEAITLQESSMDDFQKEMESKFGKFFEEVEASQQDKDIYYKFRTGILGGKIDDGDEEEDGEIDSVRLAQKLDTVNYVIGTDHLAASVDRIQNRWADIESENMEFLNKSGKYNYKLHDVTVYNDELVHEISFTPKRGGLFEGRMFVTTDSYAILRLDYAFAKGKTTENFNILGIGHSTKYRGARVNYEKGDGGYFVKYIYANQRETASIDRDFSIMKKRKRFLIDKELNEAKMTVDMDFDIDVYLEVLVLGREELAEEEFEKFRQPLVTRFRKEAVYDPDMWTNPSVIAPSAELKKYKRGEQ